MTMRQAGVSDGQQGTDWRGGDGSPSASMAVEGVQALPMGVSFTVRRRGLIRDVLAHDAAGKAVLICAPSHFGKTALLIQVVEEVRTDPKRGAAVLIDAHDAQIDELLLQLDEVEETTSGQDRPLVAIDNLPVFEACAARMLVERLRGLRRLGCGVVASCLPSKIDVTEILVLFLVTGPTSSHIQVVLTFGSFGMGILCQDLRRYPLQNRENLLILPLELGIVQLFQNALVSRLVQRL